MIGQSERFRRARAVRGYLAPARATIQARFGISERHFNAIVGLSAFIPEGQKPIMALGFTRMFQGDSSPHSQSLEDDATGRIRRRDK